MVYIGTTSAILRADGDHQIRAASWSRGFQVSNVPVRC